MSLWLTYFIGNSVYLSMIFYSKNNELLQIFYVVDLTLSKQFHLLKRTIY